MIKTTAPCDKIVGMMHPIVFGLQKTKITIQPEGYTFKKDSISYNDCQIALESIPGVKNQYGLGTVFLRNFYVGLDYDHDQMLVGLNKNFQHATIEKVHEHLTPSKPGGDKNPKPDKAPEDSESDSENSIYFAIAIILVFGSCAIGLCIYKRDKNRKMKAREAIKDLYKDEDSKKNDPESRILPNDT